MYLELQSMKEEVRQDYDPDDNVIHDYTASTIYPTNNGNPSGKILRMVNTNSPRKSQANNN